MKNFLILYEKIIPVYCERQGKHVNMLRVQNKVFQC